MKGSSFWGITLALLAAVSYGSAFALSRIVYDGGGNSLTYVALRYLTLLPLFGALLAANRTSPRMPRRLILPVVVTGLAMFVTSGGNLSAIHFIPVSLAILAFYTYPLMILLVVCVLDRRVPRVAELVAIAFTLSGLALALNAGLSELHPVGLALAIIGAAGATTVLVVSERALGDLGTLHLTFATAVVASIGAVTVTAGLDAFSFPTATAGVVALVAGVLIFAVAMVSMFAAVRRIGPVKTSLALSLEPVVGIAFAISLLGESFSGRQLLGAVLVIAGIVIIQVSKHTPAAST